MVYQHIGFSEILNYHSPETQTAHSFNIHTVSVAKTIVIAITWLVRLGKDMPGWEMWQSVIWWKKKSQKAQKKQKKKDRQQAKLSVIVASPAKPAVTTSSNL